jgi:cobalamin biosynthesis Mg chelatase CobN
MRRCILVLLALAAVASFGPGRADAATPCRDKIYNEWYHDGKVASTYPLSCYRDALKHVPAQDAVYTSLSDDIRLALQAAIARSHGQKVPSEVGGSSVPRVTSSSKPSSTSNTSSSTSSSSSKPPTETTKDTAPNSPDPGDMTTTAPVTTTPVVVASAPTSSSGGVPLPVLVLGGVALVLVASGAAGLGVRRYRRGRSA